MTHLTLLRGLVASLSFLVLTGCGFQPMYANPGEATAMRSIQIETPGNDRVDQLLGEALRDQFGPPMAGGRYRLVAESDISSSGLGVGADDIATRMALIMRVEFVVFDNQSGDAVLSDYVRSEASYDLPAQPYAAESARRDAEERAARDAAQRIAARVARQMRRAEAP